MHRAVARTKLATIFENYATLNFNWSKEKERLQLKAQLQNMIAAVQEAKLTQLKSKDLFIIIDMYLRLGEVLEEATAMEAFNTAYDLLSADSLQRDFKWYFFNARIRYCQAQLYTKIPVDFEKHAVDSCTVMRAAFAKCDIGMEEFDRLDALYEQVMNLLLTQQLFFSARENAKALLTTLVNWSDRAECTPLLKHRVVMFANKLAKLYLEHRLIDQAEEFLKQAESLAVKLLPASSLANDWVRMETAYLLGWWHTQMDMSALAGHYYKMAWELGKPHHFKEVSDAFLRFNVLVLDGYLQMRPDFSALSAERELAVMGLTLIRGIKNKRKEDFDSLLKCFTYLRDTQLPYHFEYHVYQFGVSFFAKANCATPKVLMTLVEGVEREANLKAALQALILLIEHLDTYARLAEYADSAMGESLKKLEHQQQFNAINKRLNELMTTQGVMPHPPASVSPRKASSFFS